MAGEERTARPEVGTWYRDPMHRRFEVASLDDESGVIEVRYEDGETAELALADWRHVMVDRDGTLEEYQTSPDAEEER